MNLRRRVPLICVIGIPLLTLLGQLSIFPQVSATSLAMAQAMHITRATDHSLSGPSVTSIVPPLRQYLNVLGKSIGGSYTNLQLRYLKQLKPSLSMCLFTFKKNGSFVFNEALLSEHSGRWGVVTTSRSAPVHDSLPYTELDMNGAYGGRVVGNTEVGAIPYQLIGGFINDPAVSRLELVDLAGKPIRNLPITNWGSLKIYAFAEISPTQRIQGWQVQAYDKFGSEIVPTTSQLYGK